MKVNFQATLKFKRDEIGFQDANLFAAAFKDFRDDNTWFFRFGSKEEIGRALAYISDKPLQLPYSHRFEFSLSEIAALPAFAFQVDTQDDLLEGGKVNAKKMKGKSIVADFKTGKIFANSATMEFLNAETLGISWKEFPTNDGKAIFRLHVRDPLPDPIIIPHPREIERSAYERDCYQMLSDGLHILTERNIEVLEARGLMHSASNEANRQIYKTSGSTLISGKLYAKLLSLKISGITQDFFPLFRLEQLQALGLLE